MKLPELSYSGAVKLAGSKSIIQRIMLICSLQRVETVIVPSSQCEDVLEMAQALRTLGTTVSVKSDSISINSTTNPANASGNDVCFAASGTAFRFWLARAALSDFDMRIMISEQLYQRPWKYYISTLLSFGRVVEISKTAITEYPYCLHISGTRQTCSKIEIDGSQSSQFISGMMMIAPFLADGLVITLSQIPVSMDYIRLTEHVMNDFGVKTEVTGTQISIAPHSTYQIPKQIITEPDMSSAAFFMALGAFSRAGINIRANNSTEWQPDWRFIDILRFMGVEIEKTNLQVEVKKRILKGIEIDLKNNPDLVPMLAIVALFAESKTTIRSIGHIRYKESDRLTGLINAFEMIGAEYQMQDDKLELFPLINDPGYVTLDTQDDHRLLMAFTLLQLHFPQISLSEGKSVVKSCPEFFSGLASLKKLL